MPTESAPAAPAPRRRTGLGLTPGERRSFTVLTTSKFVGNMGLRLVYPFNSDIAAGLGTSLTSVGAVLGTAELTGLASGAIGRDLDRGRYRRWALAGISAVAVGGLLMGVGGTLWALGIGFAAVVFGVATVTTSAHTWIGAHVPAGARGRAMGVYETSWAFALLVGAPIAGALIAWWAWWTPFTLIGLVAVAVAAAVARHVPPPPAPATAGHGAGAGAGHAEAPGVPGAGPGGARRAVMGAVRSFGVDAWCVFATSQLLTIGAVMSFATYGAWLKDRHGFSTGSVAALTLALGGVELLGSGGVAVFGDRAGLRRSVVGGSLVMAVAAVGMALAVSGSTPLAVATTVVLFLGFEFAFVANLTLVSGTGGAARGVFVGLNHTFTTAWRGIAAAAGTAIYERWSMLPVTVATVAMAIAASVAAAAGRPRPAVTAGSDAGPSSGSDAAG